MYKRRSDGENINNSKVNGKIEYLMKKLNIFFDDENIHNVKLSSENFHIYSLRKLDKDDQDKYIKFLRLIWLTSVYQVQFLTSNELKGFLKNGVMYKHHITVYLERLKLVKDIADYDDKKIDIISKFIDEIENKLSKNQKKDVLLLTYEFFLETNSDEDVNNFFRKALIVPDFKTVDDEKFYSKNKEMITYVESVSKVFNIEENLKYLNKFSSFKNNHSLLEKGKKKVDIIKKNILNNIEKEDNNNYVLNKIMAEFQQSGFSNLSLEQMIFLEKESRRASLENFNRQVILRAISAIKENSEDVDDLFKNITDKVGESVLYKKKVSTLIGKIEDKEKIKSFLTEYINSCIFNNVDNVTFNMFKGSIIENNQFIKIWTDCENQSLIELDTKKLLNYVKASADIEVKMLSFIEDENDVDFSEEDKLFRKLVKLNIDMENENAKDISKGENYFDRFDGVNYGEFKSTDLIKNKMKVFVDYLNSVNIESSLIEAEKHRFYINIKHGQVKQENILNLIISGILTIEPNHLDKNYNLLVKDEFDKNVGYLLSKFKKEKFETNYLNSIENEYRSEYYSSPRSKKFK